MDGQIPNAVMRQKPLSVVNPDAAAAKAIRKLAEKILEMDIDTRKNKGNQGISKLFSTLIRNKKSKK